jgi:hypothetical protein
MNFEVGMYVEYKHVKGYIHCITNDYLTICINCGQDNLYCCVLCYRQYWDQVIYHPEIARIYPVKLMP